MFTNNQSLIFSGIILLGFFICGLFNILDHFITKLVLGSLFVLIILNLFLVKKDIVVDTDDVNSSDDIEI